MPPHSTAGGRSCSSEHGPKSIPSDAARAAATAVPCASDAGADAGVRAVADGVARSKDPAATRAAAVLIGEVIPSVRCGDKGMFSAGVVPGKDRPPGVGDRFTASGVALSPLHARLPVREGRAHLRFAHRVHPRTATEVRYARSSSVSPAAARRAEASSRCPAGDAQGEAGLSSKRAMTRQPSVNASGSANHSATSGRGTGDGTGMSSATAARPATAGTASRIRRSAWATVRPSPSRTARPARTSRSASARTASAVAAAFRTGAMGD